MRTESCRLSPPGLTITGLRGCSASTSRAAVSSRLGGPTTTIRSISSRARNSSSTRASVVRPLSRTSAFDPRPSREPVPAAATIAPTLAIGRLLLAPGAGRRASRVDAVGLGKDHAPGRRLDHRGHRRGDRLVQQAAAVLHDHHGAVVEAAHALPRLLALTRHRDDDLLTRDGDRTYRLGEIVEVEHAHA